MPGLSDTYILLVPTMGKTTAEKKASRKAPPQAPKKGPPASPPKKDKKDQESPKRQNSSGQKGHTIKVYGLPSPFTCELYVYEKDPHDDDYLHGLEQYLTTQHEGVVHEGLDDANFTRLVIRCIPGSDNQVQRNRKNDFFPKDYHPLCFRG